MRSLTRFLIVFMGLRMLAPPGVCLCELSLPLVRFLADVFHSGATPVPCNEEGDDAGDCVCRMPAGVRAAPAVRPCRPSPSPEVPPAVAAPSAPVPDPFAGPAASTPAPRSRPLSLSRPLLI